MSIQSSVFTALMVYGIAALIAMLVGLLIKITYSLVHWSQGRGRSS